MTDHSAADIAATIAAAESLIGATSSTQACTDLADFLQEQQLVARLPAHDAGQSDMVCIDGAVASEQTDELAWIAAVATASNAQLVRRKTLVVPVSSAMDQVRSAVMALCEMSAAVELLDNGTDTWMDGGLVTPLLSVVTAVQAADQQTATALCDLMDEIDAAEIIDGYIDHATQGSVAALPKQDTANTFCTAWADADELDDLTRQWLPRRRDRPVAGSVLQPGQFLAPRRGVEALRVMAKPPRSGHRRAAAWARILEELMADWRELTHPWVTYAVSLASTTERAVKIELTAPGTAADDELLDLAGRRAAQACSGLTGSRVIEPYQQYVVDHLAKNEVRGLLSRLMGQAQAALMGQHPGAVTHFRS